MPGRRGQGLRPVNIITIGAAHGKVPEHLRKPQSDPCTLSHLIINTITVEVTMQATTVEAMMEEAAVGEVDVDDMLTVQQSVISWILSDGLNLKGIFGTARR